MEDRQRLRETIAKIICCLAVGKPNHDILGLNDNSECVYCHEHDGCPDQWTDVKREVDKIIELVENSRQNERQKVIAELKKMLSPEYKFAANSDEPEMTGNYILLDEQLKILEDGK